MAILFRVCLIVMFTINFGVEGGRTSHMTDSSNMKRLYHLLHQLEWSSDNRLFFERRVEPEGDCRGDILDGYRWNGDEIRYWNGIDGTQICMDMCDQNVNCMGWSYNAATKICWQVKNVNGVVSDPGVKSGSCVGSNMKIPCTENVVGQYSGGGKQVIENVEKSEDCLAKCDTSNTCFGWLYKDFNKQCSLFGFIGKFIVQDWGATGSCLAPQKRVRLPDPMKYFRRQALERHNLKRKKHCVPELTLDDDLNKEAQELAEKLASKDQIPPVYDVSKMVTVFYDRGDNTLKGGVIVDKFYDEYKYYNFNKPDFSFTNHFPKIVWKSSSKLGVGRAFTSDKASMFIVLSYDWTGDMSESFSDNVPQACE